MIVYPNAKINLGLKVIRKRSDGFHDIETLFYPIPLCDIMEVLPSNSFSLNTSGLSLDVNMEDNIVYKAWNMMRKEYDIAPVNVFLHKVIPSGAGLGGGSSDAAFMIESMNRLFDLNAGRDALASIAAEIGSDCTFFLHNEPVIAHGRGEILQPVNFKLSGYHLYIIKPDIHVNTAHAYAGITPDEKGARPGELYTESIATWQNTLVNDFEQTIFKQFPKIAEIKQKLLDAGAVYAAMSGSGAAVFGLFKNKPGFLEEDFKNCFLWDTALK